jgi:hypothetical protein
MFNFPFDVDHIIPDARGGADVDSNWALACHSCNLHKASRTSARDPATGDEVRLFNPRADWWHQHFRVDNETSTIAGITPIGRATVACLAFNSAPQTNARPRWISFGLFP